MRQKHTKETHSVTGTGLVWCWPVIRCLVKYTVQKFGVRKIKKKFSEKKGLFINIYLFRNIVTYLIF